MNDRILIRTENLHKWFPIKAGLFGRTIDYLKAVDGVSLSIQRGETLGVVGESGCGKTTLARAILRLTEPSYGSVYYDDSDITHLEGTAFGSYRKRMQMVFQDPYASLDPRQTIKSAISEPMRIHKIVSSGREADATVENLAARVGLNRDHLERYPHEFSGGQRQRIAIARALAVQPEFLILDEPTSSLDVSVQAQILNLLKDLQREFHLTYLFISHNLAVVRQMCHRTAVMYLGRVVEMTETELLYENPKHPYTHALMSSVPIPDPVMRKELGVLEGDVPSAIKIPEGCRFRSRCAYATEKCEKVPPPFYEIEREHRIECHYNIDFKSQSRMDAS